jgi:hypothetical protein
MHGGVEMFVKTQFIDAVRRGEFNPRPQESRFEQIQLEIEEYPFEPQSIETSEPERVPIIHIHEDDDGRE